MLVRSMKLHRLRSTGGTCNERPGAAHKGGEGCLEASFGSRSFGSDLLDYSISPYKLLPINAIDASEDCISLVLARQIIAMIRESGVTQNETLCALGVVQNLLPVIGIAVLRDASSDEFLQES